MPLYREHYRITNQVNLRRAFFEAHPEVSRVRYRNGEYPTDTRVAFVAWIDSLCREGLISEKLAQRATL